MIYLDNAASMPVLPQALDILSESMKVDFANPSASHCLARKINKRIEECRDGFLCLAKGHEYQFIFTSSATESNNQIMVGTHGTILVSAADHSSMVSPAMKHSCKFFELEIDGKYSFAKIENAIDQHVSMIVLTHVNGQSGTICELDNIVINIKKKFPSIHIHVDGVQAFGKIPVSLDKSLIDSYVISSHKIGGPKGIAGLFFRKGSHIAPLINGGGQEMGLRSSTLPSPLIFSFYKAAQVSVASLEKRFDDIYKLSRTCRKEMSGRFQFPFNENIISPYILMVIIPNISSDLILRHLEREEIYISSTSACSSRVQGDNPIFSALTIPKEFHKNILRVSFSHENSLAEISFFCERINRVIDKLDNLMR